MGDERRMDGGGAQSQVDLNMKCPLRQQAEQTLMELYQCVSSKQASSSPSCSFGTFHVREETFSSGPPRCLNHKLLHRGCSHGGRWTPLWRISIQLAWLRGVSWTVRKPGAPNDKKKTNLLQDMSRLFFYVQEKPGCH